MCRCCTGNVAFERLLANISSNHEVITSALILTLYARLVLAILAISVLIVGLWPAPLIDMMSVTVQELLIRIGQSKLAGI